MWHDIILQEQRQRRSGGALQPQRRQRRRLVAQVGFDSVIWFLYCSLNGHRNASSTQCKHLLARSNLSGGGDWWRRWAFESLSLTDGSCNWNVLRLPLPSCMCKSRMVCSNFSSISAMD